MTSLRDDDDLNLFRNIFLLCYDVKFLSLILIGQLNNYGDHQLPYGSVRYAFVTFMGKILSPSWDFDFRHW
jgi:hypothetical protein